jgi:hypothetical protein
MKTWLKKLCERGNHCSCFVDTLFGKYHGDCCEQHDKDYGKGSGLKRITADKRFYICLKKRTYKPIAYLMWLAVRKFGGRYKNV